MKHIKNWNQLNESKSGENDETFSKVLDYIRDNIEKYKAHKYHATGKPSIYTLDLSKSTKIKDIKIIDTKLFKGYEVEVGFWTNLEDHPVLRTKKLNISKKLYKEFMDIFDKISNQDEELKNLDNLLDN